jgi:hypothetical protein
MATANALVSSSINIIGFSNFVVRCCVGQDACCRRGGNVVRSCGRLENVVCCCVAVVATSFVVVVVVLVVNKTTSRTSFCCAICLLLTRQRRLFLWSNRQRDSLR